MPIDFATQVYKPSYAVFAQPATFYPIKSQPNQGSYLGRGVYSSQSYDVPTEDGGIYSDQRTIFDVIASEFAIHPAQGDRINIPAYASIPELGDFEIIDVYHNGGGEMTLVIRKVVEAKP